MVESKGTEKLFVIFSRRLNTYLFPWAKFSLLEEKNKGSFCFIERWGRLEKSLHALFIFQESRMVVKYCKHLSLYPFYITYWVVTVSPLTWWKTSFYFKVTFIFSLMFTLCFHHSIKTVWASAFDRGASAFCPDLHGPLRPCSALRLVQAASQPGERLEFWGGTSFCRLPDSYGFGHSAAFHSSGLQMQHGWQDLPAPNSEAQVQHGFHAACLHSQLCQL